MGDIENLQDAEDQRQAKGDNEQPRCLNQAIENDRQKEIHGVAVTRIIGGQESAARTHARAAFAGLLNAGAI
jgi:hypothetical protein